MFTYPKNRHPFLTVLVLFVAMLACSIPTPETPPNDAAAPATDSPPAASAVEPAASPQPESEGLAIASLIPEAGALVTWFDKSEFVYVPAGDFIMGRDRPEGGDNTPAHTVTLSGFWIHQAEVTNQQYAACVAAGICSPPASYTRIPYWYADPAQANAPVTGVTWEQAAAYCDWIDARLPSEAEWEKSAHGPAVVGDAQKTFPWGDQDPTCDLLNFNNCLEPAQPELVRSYPAGISPFKLLDTSGNAFEWVHDWYDDDYYPISPLVDPTGPETGSLRVYRGGGYDSPAEDIRPDERFALEPQKHAANLGFRCVLTGQAPPPMCVLPGTDDTPPPGDPDWDFDAVAYCDDRGKIQQTGVNITINMLGDEIDNYDFNVTANGTPLSCSLLPPDRLGCSGSPLSQNTNVEIEICREFTGLPVMPPEPTCPEGYFYNPDEGTCSYTLPMFESDYSCPPGYVFSDIGCVPLADNPSDCQPGFLYWPAHGICWPISQCVLPYITDTSECSRECWDGMSYDANQDCCSANTPLPFCPNGYTYVGGSYCRPQAYLGPECKTANVYIPACPTATPPPPPDECYCCQFTNRADCNSHTNNGCLWVLLGSTAYCAGP